MGATNCPETPRQRMITMMYLVYTAMLALNVSAQVIDGFKTVSQSMDASNKNIELKIGDTFENFAAAAKNNPEKVTANYEKALEIKKLSEDLGYFFDTTLYRFLSKVQTTKVAKVHIPNEDTTKKAIELPITIQNEDKSPNFDSIRHAIDIGGFSWLEKLDDTHEATKYFLGNKTDVKVADTGAAVEIKEKVAAYKKRVRELLGDDADKVDLGMKIEASEKYLDLDGTERSWEMLNFRDAVAGGALVSMVRLKAEVLNAEYEAVNMLYKQISANDYSFDKVAVLCRPKSTYIMQGQKFEMIVNVGAYDSRNHFKANIGGQTFNSNDTGAVVYTTQGTSTGPKTVTGTVYVTNDAGTKDYPFKQEYYVAAPLAVFELTEMNVVYSNIQNPIRVSVAGAAAHDVIARMADPSSADIVPDKEKGAGYYIITPKVSKGNVVVKAFVKDGKGEREMGSQTFRVRIIPDPKVYIGNYESGKSGIPANEVRNIKNISVRYGQDFAFHMKTPTVTKQNISITKVNGAEDLECKGAAFSPEVTSYLQKAKPGCKLNIEVTVAMPDGRKSVIPASYRITR